MPTKDLERRKRNQALSRQRRNVTQRGEIIWLLGGKCVKCGFGDSRALAIDHVHGNGALDRKTTGGNYYTVVLRRIKSGSTDYQLLCFNCNQIKKVELGEHRHRIHIPNIAR